MKCPNCGTENRESAKFCDECGTPLNSAVPKDSEIDEGDEDRNGASQDDDSSDNVVEDSDEEESSTEESPTQVIETIPDESEEATDVLPVVGEDQETMDSEDELCLSDDDSNGESTSAGDSEETEENRYDEGADITIVLPDLSGYDEFDETIVDADYRKPENNWRDGHTMRMDPISDGEAPKSKDFLASSTAGRQHNKRKIAIIVAIVVAIAAVVAAVSYGMQLWGGKSVPDVSGLTEAEATAMLEEEGFVVKSLEVKSDDTEGLVLVMDPSAGSRAEEGSEIVIHIATARLVPEIIGKQKAEATKMLEESGFTNISYIEEFSDKAKESVIAVEPEVGTRAKSGDAIRVTIAKPYVVPYISDKYLEDATAAIEDAGLVPDVAYVYTEDYADGIIMGTQPAEGTEVHGGDTVVIQIARSREAECIALTQAYLTPGSTFSTNGFSFEVQSLDSVTYIGEDTVGYTVTARPFVTGFGETAYFTAQPISGQIKWSDDNQIESMS